MATEGDDEPGAPGRSPGEVLAVAGSETRLSMLRALFEAEGNQLGYAALMDAVGMDDSGRFNYHLTQLVGPFVRKVEDGYRLRHAGAQVIGAVMAGTYADERPIDPVALDAPCRACGGTLVASYDGDVARIACDDCDGVVTRDSVPPGIFDGYEPAAFPAVLGRWVRHGFARTVDGFCPVCAGRTDASIGAPEHEALGRVGLSLACRRCGTRFTGALGSAVLDHPAVVCFHHDHGIDLRTVPIWELAWLHDPAEELIAEDPPAARLAIDLDDERLVVVLDADLDVVSAERDAR